MKRTANCDHGRHRPRYTKALTVGDLTRSVCRDCGCELVRTQAMRAWYASAMLA